MQPLKSLKIRAHRALGHRLDGLAWAILWGPGRKPVPMEWVPGHYYSPIPSWKEIEEQAHFEIVEVDLRRDEQVALLERLNVSDPTGPRYDEPNGYFERIDAVIYEAMIRHYRPTRVVEVGCGWSTAALFDAGAAPHVTLIDPAPDRALQLLSAEDLDRCDLLVCRLQDVPLSTFEILGAGDVLFVDSTHVSKVGSDVNRIFFEILPALASGVIVQIHDVYYPFEYPDAWVRDGWVWNETYLLRTFLQYNRAFEILLWADMLQTMGHFAGECGSIWLQKV